MVVELERAEALGIGDLVSHPGAHVGSGEEAGIAPNRQGDRPDPSADGGVCLQDRAGDNGGAGQLPRARFEHLRDIIDRVREPERLGVCVDTCHIFAAGYRLGTDAEYNGTISELDEVVGVGRVRVWHVNDSVKACGSRVDRHAGLGRGMIGREPFGRILADPRFVAVPMILETPKGSEGGEDLDAINLRVLRELEAEAASPGRPDLPACPERAAEGPSRCPTSSEKDRSPSPTPRQADRGTGSRSTRPCSSTAS